MVRLSGLATVTLGGGGAACFWASPQPVSKDAKAIRAAARIRADVGMRLGPKVMTNTGYMRREDRPGQWSRACERRAHSSLPAQRTPYLWANPKSTSHLRTVPGHAGIATGAPGTFHARPTHARCCQPAPRSRSEEH